MKSTKTRALIVLVLLALGSAWLVPGVAGAGKKKDPKKGLARRVEVLEEQVAELATRIEALEGQGPSTNSFDVIHLNPLSDFPDSPSDGDLCVAGEGESQHIYCYLDDVWRPLDMPPIPKPVPPPVIPPVIPP